MRITLLILSFLFLSGCATYKFHKGQAPYDKGYVASREGYTILEYTVGKDNSVPPNVGLAKERFKRRRSVVEHYNKKMGNIENRFKEAVIDYPVMFLKLALGVFKMPAIAIKDFRYAHNPRYRERIDKLDEAKEMHEEARIKSLKDPLNDYIQKDLEKEESITQFKEAIPAEKPVEKTKEVVSVKEEREVEEAKPQEKVPGVTKEKPIKEAIKKSRVVTIEDKGLGIKAVIVARPEKGVSPLKVRFYGDRSYSKGSRIAAYSWDFGDGDISTKANPVNIYYSGSFELQEFRVTLTVQDSKGNSASTTTTIEVLNK